MHLSDKLVYKLETARDMFLFVKATEKHTEYITDFDEFLSELKEDFNFHLENDITNYNFEKKFDDKGRCIATITIYSDNKEVLETLCKLVNLHIKEKIKF